MRKPDFFIVGAPKSGTTALHSWLAQHPQVFVSSGSGRHKEPHYHCPDLWSPRYVHDAERYEALFEGAGARHVRVGEASVYYLYSREAAQRIARYSPGARIITMLREPAEMVHSLHSQRLFSGHEDLPDFEEALAAEDDRRKGRRLPRNPHPIPVLFYRSIGRYAEQVRRYLDVFGADRVHTVLFDDFARDPAAAYAGVCRFLEVDDTHRPSFDVVNPNKAIRSSFLRDALKFSPRMQAVVRRLVPTRRVRQRIAKQVAAMNTRYEKRSPLSPALKATLREEFAEDVEALAALIGRDLEPWTRPL